MKSQSNEDSRDDLDEGLAHRSWDFKLSAAVLATAVADCRRVIAGPAYTPPTGGEVVNALSAIQFMRSRWGRRLADALTGEQGVAAAGELATRAANALGVTAEWVDAIPAERLKVAVGIYGDAYRILPAKARQKLDAPSFRFA